jgi:hypothetical protein
LPAPSGSDPSNLFPLEVMSAPSPSGGAGSLSPLIVILIVGGFLAIGAVSIAGLGAVYWFLAAKSPPPATAVARPMPAPVPAPAPINPPAAWPDGPVPVPINPVPPQPVLRPRPDYEQPDPGIIAPFPFDPKLEKPAGKVYLSELQEFAWKPGPPMWKFGKNGDVGNGWNRQARLAVKGIDYPKGLSMHPPNDGYTRVCYAVGQKVRTVGGAVAINEDEPQVRPQPTRFVILGDGKLVWRSEAICAQQVIQNFAMDISGVRILELRTYVENNNCFGAHAVWLDPGVSR